RAAAEWTSEVHMKLPAPGSGAGVCQTGFGECHEYDDKRRDCSVSDTFGQRVPGPRNGMQERAEAALGRPNRHGRIRRLEPPHGASTLMFLAAQHVSVSSGTSASSGS